MSQRTLTILLLGVIAVLSIHVLSTGLEGVRADFTSQDIYSLSDGTDQILARMGEEGVQPVEIKLYFSQTTGQTLPRFIKDFITYDRYLRQLLRSYERSAAGKIEIAFIDPLTDSDEAIEATQDGLEGRPINQHGDLFFFGLTVETQTGSKESIPFLWPQEQESIEYEISKRLTSLLWPGSKRIGVLAGLEVFGTADNPYLAQMLAAQGRQPSEKWISLQLLEESYTVSNLGAEVEQISHDDYDLVVVVHPKGLGGKALWALDEWVVTGGKTLVFVDPYSIADQAPQNPQQPWAALQYEPASSLEPLLGAWGLEMPARTFAADFDLAVKRPVVRGGATESVVIDLQLDGEGWSGSNAESPVIQGLGAVRFFMPGVLLEIGDAADDGITRAPLIATTAAGSTLAIEPGFGSGTGPGLYYTDLNDAAKLRDAFAPGSTPVAIAYQLDGRLPSAYPEGVEFPSSEPERPPGLPADIDLPPPEGTEMVRKEPIGDDQRAETTVLVYADVDFISDALGFSRNILGIIQAANDNHKVLLNSIDHLLGSRDLMSVRTARRLDRPFTRFDEIEADAEKETLDRERQIREEIEGFQSELQSKQGEITERNASLFQKRLQDEVDALNERISEGSVELRDIRVGRRAALESEENQVRFAVLGWMPTLVLILGLVLYYRRRQRESHAKKGA
ncbi:MAG: GldG family protein [Acidobacteriota bacterium]|nr:GldG family protein [Acidobacteriota bacterium]